MPNPIIIFTTNMLIFIEEIKLLIQRRTILRPWSTMRSPKQPRLRDGLIQGFFTQSDRKAGESEAIITSETNNLREKKTRGACRIGTAICN